MWMQTEKKGSNWWCTNYYQFVLQAILGFNKLQQTCSKKAFEFADLSLGSEYKPCKSEEDATLLLLLLHGVEEFTLSL